MLPVLIYAVLFVLVDSIYLTNIAAPYGKMISNIQGKKNGNETFTSSCCVFLSCWCLVRLYLSREKRTFLLGKYRARRSTWILYLLCL